MKRILLAAALAALSAAPALADGVLKSFHGGQVVETEGGWRIEAMAHEHGLAVWVRDHSDAEIAPAKLSGKATLLAAGKKLDLPLAAAAKGLSADAHLMGPVTAVLMLTIDGKPASARFTGLQAMSVHDHKGHGGH